jgi:two-component system, OmpR family, sensor histidine kinase ChvG
MVAEIQKPPPVIKAGRMLRAALSRLLFLKRLLVPLKRLLGNYVFSSLTRRILVLNLAGLAVLVSGILYLNQFREGLIDARVESLMTQGEIIAGAIASSATIDTNSLNINPEKLLELQAGESIGPSSDSIDALEYPIDPEKIAPVLRRLISPTRTRARLYDRDANLMLDSLHLYSDGQILKYDLPPLTSKNDSWWGQISAWFSSLFRRSDLPMDKEIPGANGTVFPEVVKALTGSSDTIVRLSEQGEMVVSVAVPVQRFRAVLGVLMLSTQGGDIDRIVEGERSAIFRVFAIASMVTVLLSMLLASTIANPLRRLSAAAVRVRRGVKVREEIPDFSERQDEIGNLSTALRDMTSALYARIDAIESFAADVSHELKNPLTSLRSAVETLPLAKTESSQKRLMDVIQHDVRRLDRLITDISDASRLDAELGRDDAKRVDVAKLLENIVTASREVRRNKGVDIKLTIAKLPIARKGYFVAGHDLRIGQVVTNLIENARSFVPDPGGKISIQVDHQKSKIRITIEDNGPGIRAEKVERIFERFYTDRPNAESFGQNSGLGLSISQQIIQAHGGLISAENMNDTKTGIVSGARFVVQLPFDPAK